MEKDPLHLKMPELQTTEEVQEAVELSERKNETKVPNDPGKRIEAYIDRLENVFLNPDERTRERNLDMLRDQIYDALIIKKENFPDSYFDLQKRVAREQGHGDIEITPAMREQMMEVAIGDQKHSLDAWIDYLTSNDAVYPAWFKYYAWNQIIKLSQFDKVRGEFKKRTDSTVAPYPDIYREPLAQIADIYEKVKEDSKNLKEPEIKEAFSKKFPILYAELIQKTLAVRMENGEEIKGEWVKYQQGDNGAAEKLYLSLENKGTGWCTAGRSTAEQQIKSGDFYVYYTNNEQGDPTQPRLAIRMNGTDKIGEVRGILPHQNVEPLMQSVLDEKLKEFGAEADVYRQKSEDMRHLTDLEHKKENSELFDRDDLVFLYEINSPIEGFGYERDPRIAELRAGRNTEADMLVVFDCTPEQIAHSVSELNETTQAYVGPLTPGIFQKLPADLEHIYTKWPEGKIRRDSVEVGGKTGLKWLKELKQANIKINDEAEFMLKSQEFVASKKVENADFVRLTVADLGFPQDATTEKIFKRAEEIGLELCSADFGPAYRLKYQNQPLNEWFRIGMKPITDSRGIPHVFYLARRGVGLWLLSRWAKPVFEWIPVGQFVFRFRKKS